MSKICKVPLEHFGGCPWFAEVFIPTKPNAFPMRVLASSEAEAKEEIRRLKGMEVVIKNLRCLCA